MAAPAAAGWQRFDPRRHLAAAIGWAVVGVVVVAALVAAWLAAAAAEARVRADAALLMGQFASQIQRDLAVNLATRRSLVQAAAAQIVASGNRGGDALQRQLEAVPAQFPEFAWLGLADDRGRIVAAAGGAWQGSDVSGQPWFRHGRIAPTVAEIGPRAGPASALARPLRWVEVAVPVVAPDGRLLGVLGAQLSWRWLDQRLLELLRSLGAPQQLDLLLVAGDGSVLAGPARWLGRTLAAGTDIGEGGRYFIGQHVAARGEDIGLGWRVVVRQEAAAALAPARATASVVFGVVLLAGLAAAAVCTAVTRLLTRRLARLADDAQAVRRGERAALAVPAGGDEVGRIGAALAELVSHLQRETDALKALNTELDARVAERTARIERLAEASRHAAVTRERLRLARELHDTLAHSLMALLTQIRLVRKLRSRWAEDALEAELARAEDVAASGLADARAAITQMRHNGVRDTGLGTALQDLLARFRERSGVAARLQAGPVAAGLTDERAETVFRIVEEALRNVERHAGATRVSVTLVDSPPGPTDGGAPGPVRLEVADDGAGFDPAPPRPGHYGLPGMAEQAALLGGRLVVDSAPGRGTRIVLDFEP